MLEWERVKNKGTRTWQSWETNEHENAQRQAHERKRTPNTNLQWQKQIRSIEKQLCWNERATHCVEMLIFAAILPEWEHRSNNSGQKKSVKTKQSNYVMNKHFFFSLISKWTSNQRINLIFVCILVLLLVGPLKWLFINRFYLNSSVDIACTAQLLTMN